MQIILRVKPFSLPKHSYHVLKRHKHDVIVLWYHTTASSPVGFWPGTFASDNKKILFTPPPTTTTATTHITSNKTTTVSISIQTTVVLYLRKLFFV